MFLVGFNCGHRRQRKAPPRESGAEVAGLDTMRRLCRQVSTSSRIRTRKEGPTNWAGPSLSIFRKSLSNWDASTVRATR